MLRTCSELWEKYDSLITANLMLVMDYSLKTHYHNILEQDKSFVPHFYNWLILKKHTQVSVQRVCWGIDISREWTEEVM